MYYKLNITENHLHVLSLFTNGFDRDYYIREVQKLLNISPRTAQLILESLENKGLVESKTRGKIRTYTLKRNAITRRYLTLAEYYKTLIFLERNLLIKEIIGKITPLIRGIGIIFGSYAKGTADKESDLDLFVVGEYDKNEIKKISKIFEIDISIKCYPIKNIEQKIHSDILLREILKNHIIILNAEQFMEAALKNGHD